MGKYRRIFSVEFKQSLLREIEAGLSLSEASRKYQLCPKVIRRWRREFDRSGPKAFPGCGRSKEDQARIADLEQMVGRQAMEIEFLKKALARFEQLAKRPLGNCSKP